jgi:pilus assembly protein CpaB
MGRRTILLVSALLVAALGTLLVYLYVRGADNRADAGRRTQRVLVATETIPAGTTGARAATDGSFTTRTIPADAVAQGALTDIGAVRTLVSLTTLFPGQQLVRAAFGTQAGVTSIPLPKGSMALSVQLGDPQRVAGFLGAGSQVAVFATIPDPTAASSTTATNVTTLLLKQVTVITVGNVSPVAGPSPSSGGTGTDTTIPKAIVTLAVSQLQAQKLIYAQSQGQLYFALVSDGTSLTTLPPTSLRNLLD